MLSTYPDLSKYCYELKEKKKKNVEIINIALMTKNPKVGGSILG